MLLTHVGDAEGHVVVHPISKVDNIFFLGFLLQVCLLVLSFCLGFVCLWGFFLEVHRIIKWFDWKRS